MMKATRLFIDARQKFAKSFVKLQSVARVGGGEIGKCFENAKAEEQKGKSSPNQIIAVSGWLVEPFDKNNNCTAIIQHWWNADYEGNYFDTTPLSKAGAEYVVDIDLYQYCRRNFETIKSNVGNSLLLKDGQFSMLVDPKTMRFEPISELRTEHFYRG